MSFIKCNIRIRMIRYVYTYEEFVIVTEAPQNDSDRTGHRQQNNNIQNYKNTIYNIDNYVCTGLTCANVK